MRIEWGAVRTPAYHPASFSAEYANEQLRLPLQQHLPEVARPPGPPRRMPWPAWPGTARSPTAPARASARAPSARPATCCATRPTRTSTWRPRGRSATPATWPCPTPACTAMREAMRPQVERLIRRHHMGWLGGDHSITLPLAARLPGLAGPPARGDPLRRALRHLARPLRRAQRPRHLGL